VENLISKETNVASRPSLCCCRAIALEFLKWSNNGDRTATKAQRSTSLTADLPVAPKIYDRDVLAVLSYQLFPVQDCPFVSVSQKIFTNSDRSY